MDELSDFKYFRLIYDFLHSEIDEFAIGLLARAMILVGTAALSVLTLWILVRGYRIVTGQARQPMMTLVIDSLRSTLILGLACGMALGGSTVYERLGNDLPTVISQVVTGSDTPVIEQIDRSLALMQTALARIDTLDPGGDLFVNRSKTRALWFTGIGTAGPAMSGGALLLLNQIALALFIGLGPLFLLSLLFDQTKALFGRWLYYGIGTMFSLAVLSVMVTLALDMVLAVGTAFWLGDALGGNTEGITSLAMQQGALGLILTMLIISAPPMAAAFFNGVLGNFSALSAFGNSGGTGRRGSSTYDSYAGHAASNENSQEFHPVQHHLRQVATTTGDSDQIKRSMEEAGDDFAARYPNALASNTAVGGGTPIPPSVTDTPRDVVDRAWKVAYQENVSKKELDTALNDIQAIRESKAVTHEEQLWLVNAAVGLRQRGYKEGYYATEITKEMMEHGVASQWGGGHTPSVRGIRGLDMPNGATGRQTYVPLPGGRLLDGSPAKQGPGQFMLTSERMSPRAAAYQTQITGQPPGTVYLANGVKFDGFQNGKLQDAKGPGYGTFVKDGNFLTWFKGKNALLAQAGRQTRAAGSAEIEWHFADKEAADATRVLLRRYPTIKVIHTQELKK